MRAPLIAAVFAMALALPVLGNPIPPASAAPVSAPQCQSHGYLGAKCYHVPAHGRFVVAIPGRAIVLVGQGSPEYAGTTITVAPVANPCASTRAGSFKIFTDGPIPPLSS